MRERAAAAGIVGLLALAAWSGGCGPPSLEEALPGAKLFRRNGCSGCHRLGGGGGPLVGVTERRQFEWFQTYLRNPAAFRPGTTMPKYALSDSDERDLWHYLEALDRSSSSKP